MARTLRVGGAVAAAGLAASLSIAPAQARESSPACSRLDAAVLYSTGIFREALPQMADQCSEVWGAARGVERGWIVASSCFRFSRVANCCPLAYPIVAAVGVAWAPVGLAVGPLLPASSRERLCEAESGEPPSRPDPRPARGDAVPGRDPR